MKTKLPAPFLKNINLINKDLPAKYPFNIELFKKGDFSLEFKKPISFFVGENGSGKSTLLEAIALNCGFNICGGSQDHFFKSSNTEDFAAIKALNEKLRFSWLPKINSGFFMRAENFYNYINYASEEVEYGGAYEKNLHFKSHGEAFLDCFEHRLQTRGIFLFDEPEAALSPTRQIKFLKLLHKSQQQHNSQFIIITHSPIIMSYPDADIYNFVAGKINKVKLDQVEHYKLLKDFINFPDLYLTEIMEE
jgi:predicted ATPase